MGLVAHVQRLGITIVKSTRWGWENLPQVRAVTHHKQVTGEAISQFDKVETIGGGSACALVDFFISLPYENAGGQRVQRAVSDLAAGEVTQKITRTHAPQGHNHEWLLTGPLPLEQLGQVRLPQTARLLLIVVSFAHSLISWGRTSSCQHLTETPALDSSPSDPVE